MLRYRRHLGCWGCSADAGWACIAMLPAVSGYAPASSQTSMSKSLCITGWAGPVPTGSTLAYGPCCSGFTLLDGLRHRFNTARPWWTSRWAVGICHISIPSLVSRHAHADDASFKEPSEPGGTGEVTLRWLGFGLDCQSTPPRPADSELHPTASRLVQVTLLAWTPLGAAAAFWPSLPRSALRSSLTPIARGQGEGRG